MTHMHFVNEITTFGDTERRFRCAICGAESAAPFPEVNPYTGVITPPSPIGAMEKTKIEPALDAEEWSQVLANEDFEDDGDRQNRIDMELTVHADFHRHHAAAALALYGQPFGFTREDVKMLRGIAFFLADHHYRPGGAAAANIADRIEALLPPE